MLDHHLLPSWPTCEPGLGWGGGDSPISRLRIFSSRLPTGSITLRMGWKRRKSQRRRDSS